jgi:hypothetical protein
MGDFYQGQSNIKTIYISQTEEINADEDGEIKVIMEYGQCAGVPWFEVSKKGVPVSKWNAALCLGVRFCPPNPLKKEDLPF